MGRAEPVQVAYAIELIELIEIKYFKNSKNVEKLEKNILRRNTRQNQNIYYMIKEEK